MKLFRATKRSEPPDSWVLVHSLQGSGGGILDPDDRLSDVVDDREQIIACYEEEGGPSHHIGDGTSASSSPSSSASPTHSPAFQNHGLSSKHVSRRSGL
ncbi:unnamed protein product [Notodromas monacha]|uniref:Par3/HAL N-terminal domain-containing protein n=1 Tax=Notodromas monacha TaxID=399045 RepID=A0A7R9GCD7_9CRUS|nr:unnamed protein product [Notodromas monacha]CAG0916004.1 unnamed protein product [Notodromas monacha]